MILNLKDTNFIGQDYLSKYGNSDFKWDRKCKSSNITIYTDNYLNDAIIKYNGDKIAWLVEPISINSYMYEWIKSNYNYFLEVWTHDLSIVNVIPNAILVPVGGTWVPLDEHLIHNKTNLCSFISSDKNITIGHKLRHQIRAILNDNVDQYGLGYKYIYNKADGLRSYAFSIVVENIKVDNYFTEKIIDCFLTGVIPIYYGTNNIKDIFDSNGIIFFNDINELETIIKSLSIDNYNSRIDAVKYNYEKAKEYIIIEKKILDKSLVI